MSILLKGQVFVMTHNRLNRSAQVGKPKLLPLDTLLDPGNEEGEFLKMRYFGENTIELKLDKHTYQRALARDLLEVRKFPLFSWFDNVSFTLLYGKMKVHHIDHPGKVIYNIGDKADSLFIVRQGMVQEQHEMPPKMKQLCHCRFYQAG